VRLIHVAAAAVVRRDGRALLVRKAGTTLFMQAGGKLEPGESAAQACVRELAEEVGVHVGVDDLEAWGSHEAPAANEAGHTVRGDVFYLALDEPELVPAREIAELVWVDPAAPGVPLAPLSADYVLPLVVARGNHSRSA
jgi:8-oxo-dGTP diphosphatase